MEICRIPIYDVLDLYFHVEKPNCPSDIKCSLKSKNKRNKLK
jgi:hypothetical protein